MLSCAPAAPRRATDNLWAPSPPTFLHRRAAVGIFAVYLFSCNFGSMTLNKDFMSPPIFLARQRAAAPPTKIDRPPPIDSDHPGLTTLVQKSPRIKPSRQTPGQNPPERGRP